MENLWRRIKRTLVIALLPAVLLSACGGGSSSQPTSARGWLKAAAAASSSAKSVNIAGYASQSGKRIAFNLDSFKSGALDGTFDVGGAGTRIIELPNGSSYLRATAGFWSFLTSAVHLPASSAARLAGHWVNFPSGIVGQITAGLSLKTFSSALAKKVSAKIVGHKKVGGQETVAVEGPKHLVVYVATSSPHYPLMAAPQAGSASSGQIRFSRWGKGTPPSAPKGALSAKQLLGGLG